MKFYSKGGQKRLAKIWKDNRLDDETIFSGWTGVGPSRSLILETVSDYMQNFFQFINKSEYLRMNLRLMLMHHAIAISTSQNVSWNFEGNSSKGPRKQRDLSFQSISGAHQALYHETVETRVKERESEERKRMRDLIIQGKMKPPEDFKSILLTLNALDKKVKNLEKLEASKEERLTFGALPKLTVCHGKRSSKKSNKAKQQNKNERCKENTFTSKELWDNLLDEVLQLKSGKQVKHNDSQLSTPLEVATKTPVDTLKSISPAPPVQEHIKQILENSLDDEGSWENPDFEEMSSAWYLDEDHSRSYDSDIEDDEIFADAEIHDYYGATGDIDYSMDFLKPPPLVQEAAEEKNVTYMFDKAREAVRAYRRQVLTAQDKMKKINRLINPYWYWC